MNGQNPHIDLERLARSGPTETTPCARCEKPTQSHVVYRDGDGWRDLPDANPFEGENGGGRVLLAIVCHTCREELDPEWTPDEGSESAFAAVIQP